MKKPSRTLWMLYCACLLIGAGQAFAAIAVTTYHYTVRRTGWDSHETILKGSAFPSSFGVLHVTTLDDQVDAQPLLVPAENIAGGVHDVVYVVTENNTVYGIDATSGAVLVQRNLGKPVALPLGCTNNGPNVGIISTPVIDLSRGSLYVIAYVQASSPTYVLHALNLLTLADKVTPRTVTASHTLTSGSTYTFDAKYQRQRAALLELNGAIYAGFGSFCDFSANASRGWVLGWSATGLTPLPGNELTDYQATSPTNYFLSSVWMSGYGLASNGQNIFFATGNSDCNYMVTPENCPPQSTYDGVTNIQESVVSLQASLTAKSGIFTPSNEFFLDEHDADVGSGGVMVLPTQSNGAHLATAGGKDGRLFLLNQDNLGVALDTQNFDTSCWCGESYYQGADGVGRVVSSAGTLKTWRVVLGPSPHLSLESKTSTIPGSDQDGGFFTVVSSNGTTAGTAIIWAVGRPTSSSTGVTLYAFSATPVNGALNLLFSAAAGPWPNQGGNANTVPVVANGKVYVAAYKSLTIFGPNGTASSGPQSAQPAPPLPGTKRVTGVLQSVNGSELVLTTRTGQSIIVDASQAQANELVAYLVIGDAYTVIAPAGTPLWRATSISRAKHAEAAWPPDG
jgi:hypothetical protein